VAFEKGAETVATDEGGSRGCSIVGFRIAYRGALTGGTQIDPCPDASDRRRGTLTIASPGKALRSARKGWHSTQSRGRWR
jgi:hypothetical protein